MWWWWFGDSGGVIVSGGLVLLVVVVGKGGFVTRVDGEEGGWRVTNLPGFVPPAYPVEEEVEDDATQRHRSIDAEGELGMKYGGVERLHEGLRNPTPVFCPVQNKPSHLER